MKRNQANEGIADINATREWKAIPEDVQKMFLSNAFCSKCGVATFAPGYIIRKDKYGFLIEGRCKKCGNNIVRVLD